jgi:arylformamidase
MEQIFDISRTLNASIATWLEDHKFSLAETLAIENGAAVNLSKISMSIHTGTHVDAPYHYLNQGATIEQIPLFPFWGPVQVVTVNQESGPMGLEDFSQIDLSLAPRILVRTSAGDLHDTIFPESISYPSLALVEHFADQGIILYGVDAPSVDKLDSKTLEIHKALYANQIHILEGITLKGVPDGIYELAAIPLKIEGADGSPVRAVLRVVS